MPTCAMFGIIVALYSTLCYCSHTRAIIDMLLHIIMSPWVGIDYDYNVNDCNRLHVFV